MLVDASTHPPHSFPKSGATRSTTNSTDLRSIGFLAQFDYVHLRCASGGLVTYLVIRLAKHNCGIEPLLRTACIEQVL